MGIENRQQVRAPIQLKVEYKKLNTFFADYTKNISKGGTFIRTPQPLPLGTRFTFQLAIPSFPEPVELLGEVTWSLDGEGAAKANTDPGMGIRFVFDDESVRTAFETAVEKLMVESLGPEIAAQLTGKPAH